MAITSGRWEAIDWKMERDGIESKAFGTQNVTFRACNRVAIITGANSGIGYETAKLFGQEVPNSCWSRAARHVAVGA